MNGHSTRSKICAVCDTYANSSVHGTVRLLFAHMMIFFSFLFSPPEALCDTVNNDRFFLVIGAKLALIKIAYTGSSRAFLGRKKSVEIT